jgi:hypothetical protein
MIAGPRSTGFRGGSTVPGRSTRLNVGVTFKAF